MLTATRHTRVILAAESLARATFTEILPAGDGWVGELVSLRKEFVTLTHVVSRRYDALKVDLNSWRKRVICGEIDFDPAWEDEFKGALRALIALGMLLNEKYDAYRSQGLILESPRRVDLVRSYLREAQKNLDTWESPEWETADERSVQWNKEQTSYLRKRLGTPA